MHVVASNYTNIIFTFNKIIKMTEVSLQEVSLRDFENYQEKLKGFFQKQISSKDAIIEQLKKTNENLKDENKKLEAEKHESELQQG